MYKKYVFLSLILFMLCNYSAFAQQTTIWLVRHAEKLTTNPADNNPELSGMGTRRAVALATALKGKKIATIYTTNFNRTKATVTPIAASLKLNLITYDPKDTKFGAKVVQYNAGREALIVGHSNTLIPLIKALNGTVPFNTLTDDDYDMLFKIVIDKDSKATVTIINYGEKHHTTAIPAAYVQ